MKSLIRILCLGTLGIAVMCPFRAVADLEVSGSVSIRATAEFQAPLAAHGAWIEVGSYGRCWRPASVAVEWRPYSYGHWVWTDCGWYWASDEPWAWACYHYGSWAYETGYGWIWVPGVEWAPAWVSWRFGGGYCGWAPLGPHGVIVAPSLFVFVESHRFHEPIRPRTVIVNNTTIINRTTVINNMRSETRTLAEGGPRKVMVNEGPGAAAIERASNKKVTKVSINEASRQTPVPTAVARRSTENRAKDAGESKGKEGIQRAPEQGKPETGPGRRSTPEATPDRPKGPGKKPDAADERRGAEKKFEASPDEPRGREKRSEAADESDRTEKKKPDAGPDEPRGRDKKSAEPEQPRTAPGRSDASDDSPNPPPRPSQPERKNPPSGENVGPGGGRPPQPPPPGRSQRPPRGNEKDKGRGQGAYRF
jgi:hypothetical protein